MRLPTSARSVLLLLLPLLREFRGCVSQLGCWRIQQLKLMGEGHTSPLLVLSSRISAFPFPPSPRLLLPYLFPCTPLPSTSPRLSFSFRPLAQLWVWERWKLPSLILQGRVPAPTHFLSILTPETRLVTTDLVTLHVHD